MGVCRLMEAHIPVLDGKCIRGHHLVYKINAGLAFFVFCESCVFVTPMVAASWFSDRCSTAR